MTYLVCFLAALLGIALVFYGRRESIIIIGGALYFVALFVAAIHSLHAQ